MARLQCAIAWYLCVLILGGCAGHVENKRFEYGAQTAPVFTGSLKRDLFVEGHVAYQDQAQTEFAGTFDTQGFPHHGVLTQRYIDVNNKPVTIKLNGKFKVTSTVSAISFSGAFSIEDERQQILAQSTKSKWRGKYSNVHPFQAPLLMTLNGKNQYLQYRRNISPKGRPETYPIIHRNLAGPFTIKAGFLEGLPRGVIKISAVNDQNKYFAVERQYFNYQITPQPVHYFYYEPGTFSNIELLGNCDHAPNLTVPQHLLQVFVYDCAKTQFYALSEDYPESVLEISTRDIDNGGIFHRLRIYQHGVITEANVNVDALYEGKWLYHGPLTTMFYGNLNHYQMYELGKPIGIGIKMDENGANFVSANQGDSGIDLPDSGLRNSIESQYLWYKQRVDEHFSSLLSSVILSPSELNKLKADLLKDINENKPLAKDGQVAGLPGLWESWQRQSIAQLSTWQNSKESPLALKRQILENLEKWYEQSEVLLLAESSQRCARAGKSLNSQDWRCELRPNSELIQVCERYFDVQKCQTMSDNFVRSQNKTK
ncbi:Uncharacterised protein [Zhongshania aliphaticivorans]|uniref:Lipoprotein n=1 Tax=Zhongshania aliphaticivorans TaxID=1470434 RepID=A0A5S9NIF2_9GAMM|nr:hypothetical protein [Zhongshania aliphaticivorans]CAA0088527.1 Uncharacterised protein [Zhongshania aliphaticivorans]CAA0094583.1 Uncharacterised protein [Zhongshania aliphaticivorans]